MKEEVCLSRFGANFVAWQHSVFKTNPFNRMDPDLTSVQQGWVYFDQILGPLKFEANKPTPYLRYTAF